MTESIDAKVARLMAMAQIMADSTASFYEGLSGQSVVNESRQAFEAALRTELEAVQGEPVGDSRLSIGMGAVYDFAGFLTTRSTQVIASGHDEAGPVAEAIKEFFNTRGIHHDPLPDVQTWHITTPQPASNEADQLLKALRLDPNTYRTDGGWLNIPKIMAAIKSPEDYPQANYDSLINSVKRQPVAQAEPVSVDAERYRWLREHCDSMSLIPQLTVAKVTGCGLEGWSGDDLNEAIDAARGVGGAV